MKNKPYRPILYYLFITVRAFFYCMPYRVTFSFSGSMGKLAFYLLSKERKKTLKHLHSVFAGEKSDKEIFQLGRTVFENHGKTLCEFAMIDKLIPRMDELVTVEHREYMDQAVAAGKGVIIAVAHFGNWELMGGYYGLKNYPVNVVARKIYYKKYNDLLVSLRKKLKMSIIYRDSSPKLMLAALKRGEILCLAVDQDIDMVDGTFVNFFNRPANTPIAPVRFSLATGAPILSAFIIRKGIRHHIVMCPPIDFVNTGNKEEDIRVNTQKWVRIQEEYIREHPHLWAWNHKRWKTNPNNI